MSIRPPPSETLAGPDKDNRAAAKKALDYIERRSSESLEGMSVDAVKATLGARARQREMIVKSYEDAGLKDVARIIEGLMVIPEIRMRQARQLIRLQQHHQANQARRLKSLLSRRKRRLRQEPLKRRSKWPPRQSGV